MSSFQYEKTQNIVSKKKELISAKKYLLAKDGENQKYAVFHLINNYKETVNKIVLIINQYDKDGKLLATNEVPYEDLNIKSHSRFVPFFKLALDDQTERIETNVVAAYFENHKYENGKLIRVKKEKKQKEDEAPKAKDTIDKDVKVMKSKYPLKSFLILSLIVLVIMGIFIGVFSFSSKEIMFNDMSFDTSSGEITRYYGSSKTVSIPKVINGQEVKAIKNRAFMGTVIQQVNIDADDIAIGDYAFAKCAKLTTFSANNISKLGNYAFENCSDLTTISTSGIKEVGEGAFVDCRYLSDFIDRKCEKIGMFAFRNCYAIERVIIPNAIIPNMLFEENTNLKEFEFKDIDNVGIITLPRIFSNTIEHDNLTISTYMDNLSVDFFGEFKYKKLSLLNSNVHFEANAYDKLVEDARRNGGHVQTPYMTKVYDVVVAFNTAAIGTSLVIDDPTIKGITIDSVKSFAKNITHLELNTNMTLTEEFLNNFSNTKELVLGSLINVEDKAVSLYRLTDITMPVIGKSFINLFKILPNNLNVKMVGFTNIPEEYFKGASTVKEIEVSGAIDKIGKKAISGCANLTTLTINNNVATFDLPIIDGESIRLSNVSLPFIGKTLNEPAKYVEVNESGAFTRKLTLSYNSSIKLVEDAFERSVMITSLSIEAGIDGEATNALKSLKSLNTLVIGGGLSQKLSAMGLTKVDNLGLKIFSIMDGLFDKCEIKNLYIASSAQVGDNTFSNTDNISNIYFSRYCFVKTGTTYKEVLDKIILLKNISFESNSVIYDGTKNARFGIDFSSEYNNIFN